MDLEADCTCKLLVDDNWDVDPAGIFGEGKPTAGVLASCSTDVDEAQYLAAM